MSEIEIVKFRYAPPEGPRWIPARFRSSRFEIKENPPPNSIVDFDGLAERCRGDRGTDFQMCITLAGRLADADDSRWVGYPFAAAMDD